MEKSLINFKYRFKKSSFFKHVFFSKFKLVFLLLFIFSCVYVFNERELLFLNFSFNIYYVLITLSMYLVVLFFIFNFINIIYSFILCIINKKKNYFNIVEFKISNGYLLCDYFKFKINKVKLRKKCICFSDNRLYLDKCNFIYDIDFDRVCSYIKGGLK